MNKYIIKFKGIPVYHINYFPKLFSLFKKNTLIISDKTINVFFNNNIVGYFNNMADYNFDDQLIIKYRR